MSVITKTFTAAADVSTSLFVKPGKSFTFALAGTWDGAVIVLRRSNNGGQTWETLASYTSDSSGTIQSEPGGLHQFLATSVGTTSVVLTLKDLSTVLRTIDLAQSRVWDARQTTIVGTAANDDLALVTGTFLTDAPSVQSGDLKAAGATTRYTALDPIPVTADMLAGGNLSLRLNAGMLTTISDTTATIDIQVVRRAAPTVDLCTTTAQSINSLTAADKDFELDKATVVAGDLLDVRVVMAISDAATVTAVIGKLNSVQLLSTPVA